MNRNRASNIASLILLILIGVVLIVFLISLFWQRYADSIHSLLLVLEHGSEQEIENYLRARDFSKGLFLVFLISAFQVVSIIIPGMPIQIAAGSIYGWWGADDHVDDGLWLGKTTINLCRAGVDLIVHQPLGLVS